jgi:uncharacterized membrane protein YcaP (DUF421 family)
VVAFRTTFVFFLILLVTRTVGRRELSSMEPFDLILLVADGRILEKNLRRERMTLEEVKAEARQAQIDSLDDVRFAVLETNGRISFVTRS